MDKTGSPAVHTKIKHQFKTLRGPRLLPYPDKVLQKMNKSDLQRAGSFNDSPNRRYHLQDGVIGKKLSKRLPLKFYGESFGEIKIFVFEIFNFR